MGEFIKLNKKHYFMYNNYIKDNFYSNLYLGLDFSTNFNNNKSNKKDGYFYGYVEDEKLLGVFVFSNNRILHLSFIDDKVLKKLDLIRAIKYYKPKIIKGKKENLNKVVNILKKSIGNISVNDYNIMKFEGNEEIIYREKSDSLNNELLNNSFEFLINVEKAFDRNPKLINETKYKLYNKYNKNEYFVYVKNDKIISQGLIENKGSDFVIIGSIYTEKKYRKKGYGEKIVKNLINEVKKRNKTPILLVKKTNIKAINLYKKLNFSNKSDFRIVELEIL